MEVSDNHNLSASVPPSRNHLGESNLDHLINSGLLISSGLGGELESSHQCPSVSIAASMATPKKLSDTKYACVPIFIVALSSKNSISAVNSSHEPNNKNFFG